MTEKKTNYEFGLSANPLVPPVWDSKTAWAIKALYEGKANEGQQADIVRWLEVCTGLEDLEFRPGDDGRLSAFQSGKRFVGLQFRKLRNLPPDFLRKAAELEAKKAAENRKG